MATKPTFVNASPLRVNPLVAPHAMRPLRSLGYSLFVAAVSGAGHAKSAPMLRQNPFTFTVAAGAIAVVAAVAMSAQSSALLPASEVRQLVQRGQPADHARLEQHFAAVAESDARNAARHVAMARSYDPAKAQGISMRAHCNRLAELDRQGEAANRELAGYHKELAAGAQTAPPRGQGSPSAAARQPSDAELSRLASQPGTAADHRALADYFRSQSQRYTADAEEHAELARAYRANIQTVPKAAEHYTRAAAHCDTLSAAAREAAKEATAAAESHQSATR
jgi:hypothetical protein